MCSNGTNSRGTAIIIITITTSSRRISHHSSSLGINRTTCETPGGGPGGVLVVLPLLYDLCKSFFPPDMVEINLVIGRT